MFPFAVLSPRGNRFLIFHLPLPVAFGWSQLQAQPAAPQPTALLLCFSYCQPELGKTPPAEIRSINQDAFPERGAESLSFASCFAGLPALHVAAPLQPSHGTEQSCFAWLQLTPK